MFRKSPRHLVWALCAGMTIASAAAAIDAAKASAGDRFSSAVVTGVPAYQLDFHMMLLDKLGIESMEKGGIVCKGCEELKKAEYQSDKMLEVTYTFPESDPKVGPALGATWLALGGEVKLCDVGSCGAQSSSTPSRPGVSSPNCNDYLPPSPCYSRPGCLGGSTPLCGRYPGGSCAYCP